ncbi:GIY-YIG nuclease family protein [Rudaeicoccus suwonensis]|nr:GIY-YIG nuclease family protein [Rudaeicoccus suwonensis]
MAGEDAFDLPMLRSVSKDLLECRVLIDERGLFELTAEALQETTRPAPFDGQKRQAVFNPIHAQRFITHLEQTRQVSAARVLTALEQGMGLSRESARAGTSHRASQWSLLRWFGSIHMMADATAQELATGLLRDATSRGVSPRTQAYYEDCAEHMAAWFALPWSRDLLQRWDAAGIRMREPRSTCQRTIPGTKVTMVSAPERSTSSDGHEIKPITEQDREAERRRTRDGSRAVDDVYRHGGHVIRSDDADYVYCPENPSLDVVDTRQGFRTVLTRSEFHRFLAKGPGAVPPSTPAADSMWAQIRDAHPGAFRIGSRGQLPQHPAVTSAGALYMYTRATGQIVVVLAGSLQSAIDALESDSDVAFARTRSVWVPGSIETLRRDSPVLRDGSPSPLQRGRTRLIQSEDDWANVPHIAGIYRIHLIDELGPSVYIGRSQDLRIRPRRHEKTAGRSWSDGTSLGIVKIELIRVKGNDQGHAWSMFDLDNAEALHIARAQERALQGGPRVLNITGGRNGPPSRPRSQMYVWKAESSNPPLEQAPGWILKGEPESYL